MSTVPSFEQVLTQITDLFSSAINHSTTSADHAMAIVLTSEDVDETAATRAASFNKLIDARDELIKTASIITAAHEHPAGLVRQLMVANDEIARLRAQVDMLGGRPDALRAV